MSKYATLSIPDGYTVIVLETKKADMINGQRPAMIESLSDYVFSSKNGKFVVEKNRTGDNGHELSSFNVIPNHPLLSIRSE